MEAPLALPPGWETYDNFAVVRCIAFPSVVPLLSIGGHTL